MTHSEKSHIHRMKAWPYRQERRGHDPTKKNLFHCGKVCTNPLLDSLSKANEEVESGAVRPHLGFSKTCGRPTGYSAVRAEEDMGVPRASDRAVKDSRGALRTWCSLQFGTRSQGHVPLLQGASATAGAMSKRVLEEKRVGVHKETATLKSLHALSVSGGRVLTGTGLTHV